MAHVDPPIREPYDAVAVTEQFSKSLNDLREQFHIDNNTSELGIL